jgi:hypothetical protein
LNQLSLTDVGKKDCKNLEKVMTGVGGRECRIRQTLVWRT